MHRDIVSVVSVVRGASTTVRSRFGAVALTALGWLIAPAPALAATLEPEAAAAFTLETFASELMDQATDIVTLPDGRAVITLRHGDIVTVLPDKTRVTDHIDVLAIEGEQGLLGVVADPNFATNQYIYFYASANNDADNRHQVHRYKLGADSKLDDMKVLVNMGLKGPANHNGGGLDFYNGALYISVGDTGSNSVPPSNKFGTCLNVANGKILRVHPDTGMPMADNPLMAETMVTGCNSPTGDALGMQPPDKRIYAWGFRNPYRFQVDPKTGKLWIGDVGEADREEISVGDGGVHYGFPFFEGNKEWDQGFKPPNACMGITPATACLAPAYDYDHGGQKDCVIGGVILDGCDWPAPWKTRYIFGDHGSGEVWTLDVNPARDGVVAGSLKLFARSPKVASFKMGLDNALYIVEEGGDGKVERITAKGAPTTCLPPAGGGSGGNGGSGGSNSNAGSPAGGVSAGGKNGGGGGPNGGAAVTAGRGGTNAASGGNAAGSADEGGCGCRTVGSTSSSPLGLGVLVSALALAMQRRRRSARR